MRRIRVRRDAATRFRRDRILLGPSHGRRDDRRGKETDFEGCSGKNRVNNKFISLRQWTPDRLPIVQFDWMENCCNAINENGENKSSKMKHWVRINLTTLTNTSLV